MNPLLLAIAANTIPDAYTGEDLITPGDGTWTPPAEIIGQSITVQCWGAGANGAEVGGGGGEFAQSNFTVAGNVAYHVGGSGGNDTYWDADFSQEPYATGATGQSGGTGGTGTITYDGGDGGNRNGPRAGGGGGAGGDLGAGSNGGDANAFGAGDGGSSGNTDPAVGKGGGGGNLGQNGQDGVQPGGGGGGSATDTPGSGADGMIRIIFPAI